MVEQHDIDMDGRLDAGELLDAAEFLVERQVCMRGRGVDRIEGKGEYRSHRGSPFLTEIRFSPQIYIFGTDTHEPGIYELNLIPIWEKMSLCCFCKGEKQHAGELQIY